MMKVMNGLVRKTLDVIDRGCVSGYQTVIPVASTANTVTSYLNHSLAALIHTGCPTLLEILEMLEIYWTNFSLLEIL